MAEGTAMGKKRFQQTVKQKGAWRSNTNGITYYRRVVVAKEEREES